MPHRSPWSFSWFEVFQAERIFPLTPILNPTTPAYRLVHEAFEQSIECRCSRRPFRSKNPVVRRGYSKRYSVPRPMITESQCDSKLSIDILVRTTRGELMSVSCHSKLVLWSILIILRSFSSAYEARCGAVIRQDDIQSSRTANHGISAVSYTYHSVGSYLTHSQGRYRSHDDIWRPHHQRINRFEYTTVEGCRCRRDDSFHSRDSLRIHT